MLILFDNAYGILIGSDRKIEIQNNMFNPKVKYQLNPTLLSLAFILTCMADLLQ